MITDFHGHKSVFIRVLFSEGVQKSGSLLQHSQQASADQDSNGESSTIWLSVEDRGNCPRQSRNWLSH